MAWSLVQYHRGDEVVEVGIHIDGRTYAAPAALVGLSAMEVLRDWGRCSEVLRFLDVDSLTLVPDAQLLAPLTFPGKVLCVATNYYDHTEEMGVARPDPRTEPFFFLKAPTTTVVGPTADVAIPVDGRSNIDWEAELGVVIGRRCVSLDESDAAGAIAGYLVANDISDRGTFHRDSAVGPPFQWDWLAGKSQDGFCPVGPGMVPAWLVPEPQALKIRLDVNGVVKQESSTSQMVSGINRLVAAASRLMTLEPGDIILTGTPAGVGLPRQEFLHPGDVVSVEIQGCGRISNRVVSK